MTEDLLAEVSAWFRGRGFDLSVAAEDAVWWAKLTPVSNPAGAMTRYGRGDTPEAAAERAQERYEQEQ